VKTTDDFFAALWERRGSAMKLTPCAVRYRDGSAPAPGACHINVDHWIRENENYEAVRGWIPMNYGFERHSVVRDCAGLLVDITLSDSYRFLIHSERRRPATRRREHGFNQVFWPRNSN
jgi:hypothetical protein